MKHTPAPWHINHWEHGESGVKCLKKESGITYFSGDGVTESSFGIRAEHGHGVQSSFEGAHIAEITDFNKESMANAKLIAAAPELLEACQRAMQVLEDENIFGQARLLLAVAIRKATE